MNQTTVDWVLAGGMLETARLTNLAEEDTGEMLDASADSVSVRMAARSLVTLRLVQGGKP